MPDRSATPPLPAPGREGLAATSGALPTPERLRALLGQLGSGLLERDAAVRLVLLAALAGEHVLLIGPPGTAKSALARRLHRAFADTRYFERLLTRFSTPEELFGPLSLRALEADRYERLTDGYLPTAGIAFLDEVFKANSAILNALLTLLNERLFDNGAARTAVPLVAVIGATNEVPEDASLAAFHDRFLVRVPVAPVGDDAFAALLALPAGEPPAPARPIDAAERQVLAAAAAEVTIGRDFVEACAVLRRWLGARGQALSDRRWRRLTALARTAAAAEGRCTLDRLDLWLAPYVAAATPAEAPALQRWFVDEAMAAPAPDAAPWLGRAVAAFERQLELEQQRPADDRDGGAADGAGKMALARTLAAGAAAHGTGGEAAGGAPAAPLRLLTERVQMAGRHRFGARHVAARVAQVGALALQVDTARARSRAVRARLAETLPARWWWPDALGALLASRHDAALALLDEFATRLLQARLGFARLPVDDAHDGDEPAPVAVDGVDATAPDGDRPPPPGTTGMPAGAQR